MYGIKKIMEVIPHRQPFLLIDKITEVGEYKVGQKAVATKAVTINEDFFRGHFPKEPVMPGVLIVEALAQTGAFMILNNEKNKGKLVFFGALDKVKFKKVVVPGDTLTLEIELTKCKKNAGVGKGVAYVDGKVAVSCTLTFFIK